MKIGYVVLYCQDVALCRNFWIEKFGMVEKNRKSAGGFEITEVGFGNQDFSFELVPLGLMQNNPDGLDLATPSIAFYAENLTSWQEELRAVGVQTSEIGNHSGRESFAFSDNENRWFAVIQA